MKFRLTLTRLTETPQEFSGFTENVRNCEAELRQLNPSYYKSKSTSTIKIIIQQFVQTPLNSPPTTGGRESMDFSLMWTLRGIQSKR